MATVTARSRNDLVIGDPASNRLAFYREARQRLGLPPAHEVSWTDLLARGLSGTWDSVRLESPGKCPYVERSFLEAVEGPELPPVARGRLVAPARWFAGFQRALDLLPEGWPFVNPPSEVLIMFDKRRCHGHLSSRGVPVPEALPGVSSYQELRSRMAAAGWERAFVKVFCGSSCSGTLAYSLRAACGFAPLERVAPGEYYNSRRVRRYSGAVLEEIVDWLCAQGAHVERWLEKSVLDGLPYDLRVVVIAGGPCHVVARRGRAPMLGLHLGAARGTPGPLPWLPALTAQVAAAFPRSHYFGLDVLVDCAGQPWVLEVNAFGDLLPGLLWEGMDTYTAEMVSYLRIHPEAGYVGQESGGPVSPGGL